MTPGRAHALAASLLLLLTVACGGGGGGGGGSPTEPTPTPPPAAITFTPDGAPPPASVGLAAAASSTASSLFLELRATQATDLYGVAFDLTYPSGQLAYAGAVAGPALQQATVQASVSTPGTLVVGVSSLGQVPGLTGSGVLATLRFDAVAAGEGRFAFARNQAFRSNGQPVAGLSWIGGGVRIVR